ncbi:MAG: putative DNA binding domain-containing protein [Gammaproteobacteria bacterium]|nr:putative DNA binding domain-containing protein [Gammaproteobacteria bacterium]
MPRIYSRELTELIFIYPYCRIGDVVGARGTRMTPEDTANLWKQVYLGEDTELEFKEVRFRGGQVSAPRRDAFADEVAAFANGDGGRLVLGVADDRRPQGLDPEQLDALVSMVGEIGADSIKPPVNYRVLRVAVPEPGEGGALVVDVPEGFTVHRSPGGHLRRRGDSRWQMDSADIRRVSFLRGQSDVASTDTQVVQRTGVASLQPRLWRRYLSSRVNDPDDVALAKLKFVKDDASGTARATVAGVLLASDDPSEWLPNAWIQAVCYAGEQADASRQLDVRDITGPLDQQIREALHFVIRNRRLAAYKDPGRVDVPQFSERAVFEAVVNAVVHRDYAVSGSRIRLFMFDDRLEIYSPGGLCNSMTTADLRTSQFTRNELIASRLGQCPADDVSGAGGRPFFVERRGEGIGVIEDETFALSGRRARFEVIGERELKVVVPAARPPVADGVAFAVAATHGDTGAPLAGVDVLMVYPNRTSRQVRTDAFGRAEIVLHAPLPMTIMFAADGFAAHVERERLPEDEPLAIGMRASPSGGSQIIANRTGRLEGIQGRLNPILDAHDRTYLYADNIAVNDGEAQPVHFTLNEPVRLTDAHGANATLWFREILGASCVFDYRRE